MRQKTIREKKEQEKIKQENAVQENTIQENAVQENSLTAGPIRRPLVRFAIPVILSMLAAQLYSVADSMIIGWKLDSDALAAASNGAAVLMFFLFVSGGMELAGNLLIAAKKPVFQKKQMEELTWNLLFVDGILALVMTVLGIVGFRALLILINTPEEILADAWLYGVVYMVGLPFQMIYDLAKQILIGYGDSKTPLYTTLFTSVLNVILDIVLVDLAGIGGAAAASALAQVVGCVIVYGYLRRTLLEERFQWNMPRLSYWKEIFRLAPANTLQQMSGVVVTNIKQGLLGSIGVDAIAGFSCASRMTNLILIPVYGFVQSLVTFIAQNLALNQEKRIKEGMKTATQLLMGLATILILICLCFHDFMMALFTDNQEAVRYGAMILVYEPFSYYFTVMRHVQEAKLRGKQDMMRYLISSMTTMAVNIFCAIILVHWIGYPGFFVATWISSFAGMILSIILVRISDGRNHCIVR